MSSLSNLFRNGSLWRYMKFVKSKLCLQNNISEKRTRRIGWWMASCAGMSAGAIFLGGVTRLTESGLSMTDWKLIKDMRLPSSENAWEEEFEKYKQFPEWNYLNKEREMTLSQFKFIYFMEYFHRIWGRATGLVFFLPFAYFWSRGYFSRKTKFVMLGLGSLLGLQGFLGWYMVRSGLDEKLLDNNVPRVSQYRLTIHLTAAAVLYAGFLWASLNRLLPDLPPNLHKCPRPVVTQCYLLLSLISLTMISGAFVAGLDAGLVYNTFPRMADRWIPDDYLCKSPSWKNLFENPAAVQFNHRLLAALTFTGILSYHFYTRRLMLHKRLQLARVCLLSVGCLQVGLGIATLLLYVPVWLASSHQMGSMLLLSSGIWLANELKRVPKF